MNLSKILGIISVLLALVGAAYLLEAPKLQEDYEAHYLHDVCIGGAVLFLVMAAFTAMIAMMVYIFRNKK